MNFLGKMGCNPRKVPIGSLFPVFSTIPRNEWKEIDFSHLVPEVLDQDGQNSCNAFASIQAIHVSRAFAGLPYIRLSPGNLYGRINGGIDGGSTLSDALKELKENGVCRADIVPIYVWRPNRWPSNWKEDAKKFRLLEVYDCPTFDHLASAILQGFPVNLGVMVGYNFYVEDDGWLRDYRRGYGGHAMCGVGLLYHKERQTWGIKIVNSWGSDWGINGFAVLPESYFKNNWFNDGWAIRVVVDPEGNE